MSAELHMLKGLFSAKKKRPLIVGVLGSVSVGKTHFASELVSRTSRSVSVSTDNFLLPNKVLIKKEILHRKGFPESYDSEALVQFLESLGSGQAQKIPQYDHKLYNIVPHVAQTIPVCDVYFVEGVNLGAYAKFLDTLIFLEADQDSLKQWYLSRHARLRKNLSDVLTEQDYLERGNYLWESVNWKNYQENILPHKAKAHVIVRKNRDHTINAIQFC